MGDSPCFAAVTARQPHSQQRNVEDGFRKGKMPSRIFAQRYLLGSRAVTKSTVVRADHSWIHGRDHDSRQERLRRLRVAFVGCGSVGSSVARLLVQAGAGNLYLVDPEQLDWENTGRHQLDARSVGKPKSKALAAEIESGFPHLTSVRWTKTGVGLGSPELMSELESCDLVVSTMGNWNSGRLSERLAPRRARTPRQFSTDGWSPMPLRRMLC